MSFPHTKQLLTYNFLHAHGLAPRLYDLVEIETSDGELRVGYVVEHVDGEPLAKGDCAHMVASLRALERRGVLKLISAAGWSGIDFQEPDGNGNIIRSSARQRPLYVDIHNFVLHDYSAYLAETWRSVGADRPSSHERLTARARGFYESLFGSRIAVGSVSTAAAEIGERLLAQAGLAISGRNVFAWQSGLMLEGAEYLRCNAHWLCAFGAPEKLPATERLLLALGCTRFSLSAIQSQAPTDPAQPIPPYLNLNGTGATGSLLIYRAGPDERGWAAAALALPWKYMLYEHHRGIGSLSAQLEQLAGKLRIRVVGSEMLPGEPSEAGTVALIERTDR